MFNLSNIMRKTTLLACCLVGLIVVVALILSVKTNSQQRNVLNQKDKGELLKRVEKSAEIPFNTIDDNDTPLRITEATVKEISGEDFTRLTGKTTDLAVVSSFPEVKLINTSEKTITSFFVIVRNAATKSMRGFRQSNVSIAPGQSYEVKREHFVDPKKEMFSDGKGARQTLEQPKMDSEKFWLDFGKSPDVFITIPEVTFEDRGKWQFKEGGKIK